MNYVLNHTWSPPERPRDGGAGLSRQIANPDISELSLRKMPRLLPSANVPFTVPVAHVLSMGPNKQVLRVHTRRVIAPVANARPIGYGTEVDLPAGTMCEHHFPASATRVYLTIPIWPNSPAENPAPTSGDSCFFEETILERSSSEHSLPVHGLPCSFESRHIHATH